MRSSQTCAHRLAKLQSAATLDALPRSRASSAGSNLPDGLEELEHVSDLSEGRRSRESHCSGTSCQVEDRMSSRGRYTWSQQSFLSPPAARIDSGFIQQHKGKQLLINVLISGGRLEGMKEAGWSGCYVLPDLIQNLWSTGMSTHGFLCLPS